MIQFFTYLLHFLSRFNFILIAYFSNVEFLLVKEKNLSLEVQFMAYKKENKKKFMSKCFPSKFTMLTKIFYDFFLKLHQ